ncbi:MAG: HIT family protein [Saprospiraceae bacterium]|nr:HIT family protein [Saprospiraceae bacterium]
MASVFSRIVNGEIPSYKVAESDKFYAFLDINPLMKGHTLVIPKVEVDYIFDLDNDTYNGLFAFAKKVSRAIKNVIPCERIGVVVMGMEVPHAHIHLIPINKMSDMDFTRPKLEIDSAEFLKIAGKIEGSI